MKLRFKAMLAVDDDDHSAASYLSALAQAGFKVTCASSAAAAKSKCRPNRPVHILIIDVLFKNSGAVAWHVRRMYPSACVLFVSTFRLETLLKAGAVPAEEFACRGTAFLRKPLPATVLMSRVWNLMGAAGIPQSEQEAVAKPALRERAAPLLARAAGAVTASA